MNAITSTRPVAVRLRRWRRAWRSLLRSRHGGAMLVSGVLTLTLLLSVGAAMSNLAWHEAQIEEARAALRAAVAASARTLQAFTGDQASTEAQHAREQIARFLDATVPRMEVDDSDVSVQLIDPRTREIRITVSGDYELEDIWAAGGQDELDSGLELVQGLALDTNRYEVAIAADITYSMSRPIDDGAGGGTVIKMDALKVAMDVAADTMDAISAQSAGTMVVSVVPFGSAVRVADTGGAGETYGKQRYVRMLTGDEPGSAGALSTSGHWVDTFHDYGTGADMGPLAQQNLAAAYGVGGALGWDMGAVNVDVDVSAQVPALGAWTVNAADFWNGCVMARWGAYWEPDARPVPWDPNDPGNWPAKTDVPGWTTAAADLRNAPLHLSDDPPDPTKPSTRFTAYSWPDGSISGTADARLHAVMAETLVRGALDDASVRDLDLTAAYHNWSQRSQFGGGDALCPGHAIMPLTEDATALRAKIASLDSLPLLDGASMTFLHLGVVWALRTVSPLWRDVWQTADAQTPPAARPLVNCAPGDSPEDAGCDERLQKSIILITDGANFFSQGNSVATGRVAYSRYFGPYGDVCTAMDSRVSEFEYPGTSPPRPPSTYDRAMESRDADAFGAVFGSLMPLDRAGRFKSASLDRVLDAFDKVVGAPANAAAAQMREQALTGLTPWELFRGSGFRPDDSNAIDILVDPNSALGLDGRPMGNDICRHTSYFSPYGQLDDLVNAGGEPVAGTAPFAMEPSWRTLSGIALGAQVVQDRLDPWFLDACSIAGLRRVRINAVYIGDATATDSIQLLEECVDRAGGDPLVAEVFVTPTAADLRAALEALFEVRGRLRFLN